MAGGKETPRQKMIGLMYLVLMAMLAMNVSKEIINAFVTIDEKMAAGNTLTREGINRKITEVNMAYQELKSVGKDKEKMAKQEALLTKLSEIVELGKGTQNYLVEQASDMIVQTEPAAPELAKVGGHYDGTIHPALDAGKYYYTDESGFFHLASTMHMTKKDDYDAPTRIFVGADHKNISEEGKMIRTKIEEFRDALVAKVANYEEMKGGKLNKYEFGAPVELATNKQEDRIKFDEALEASLANVNPSDKDKIRQIYQLLTYPQETENHGEMYPWQAGLFDHSPVVAAAAMFTSLKGDVERAEAIAVNLVASKSEKPKFNFNKIDAMAFSNKGYINTGDSLQLKVMIAAYDSAAPLNLKVWEEDSTRSGDPTRTFKGKPGQSLALGKGKGTGRHKVYGLIEVEEDGGKKWKPWEFDYEVGSPTGTVANTEMNVLYIGYDNKIRASASGYSSFKASCSGCSMSGGSNGEYIAKVTGGKEATITVSGVTEDGGSVTVAQEKFRIKRLPDPTPVLVGNGVDKSTIKLGKLKQAKKLNAELKGSPINLPFNITSFKMTVIQNGEAVTVKSSGAKLSGKMLNMVKKIKAGQKVYIEDVYAKSAKGGKAKKIPGLIFKVVR